MRLTRGGLGFLCGVCPYPYLAHPSAPHSAPHVLAKFVACQQLALAALDLGHAPCDFVIPRLFNGIVGDSIEAGNDFVGERSAFRLGKRRNLRA